MPLGLTTKVSATDAAIQMNIYGSAMPTLIIKHLLKNQVYWWKGVSKTIDNETEEQKGVLLSMSLIKLGASLLRNLETSKGVIRAGEGMITAGNSF